VTERIPACAAKLPTRPVPNLSRDPIANVIYGQITHDIRVLVDAQCLTGAIKLVYSGIDTMAYLDMDANKLSVERGDFIRWCDRYIRFPGRHQLTGTDLYGARCALLHQHGTESKLSRDGACREVGYADNMDPPVLYRPEKDKQLVLVSPHALIDAFLRGVDTFIVDLFANKPKAAVAERRFEGTIHVIPAPDSEPEAAG
jgi:hypothetical protein